jgi:hypothetical protein
MTIVAMRFTSSDDRRSDGALSKARLHLDSRIALSVASKMSVAMTLLITSCRNRAMSLCDPNRAARRSE